MQMVEPSTNEDSWRADAATQLIQLKVPPAVAQWWAQTLDAIYRAAAPAVSETDRDYALAAISKILMQPAHVAIIEFIARWCGLAPSFQRGLSPANGQRSLDDPSVGVLLNRARDLKTDFEAGLLALPKSDIHVGNLAALLFQAGALRPEFILDLDAIRQIGADEAQILPSVGPFQFDDPAELKKLEFWLLTVGPCVLDGWAGIFIHESIESLGFLARGMRKIVQASSRSNCTGPTAVALTPQNLASEYIKMVPVLRERTAMTPPGMATNVAWWMAHQIGRFQPELISDDLRKNLVRECTEYWGRFRADLRRGIAPDEAAAKRESLHDAMCVIAILGSPWQAFKALLLAFRALRKPAVSDDLRYWPEQGEDWRTYEPWGYFARVPAELLHSELGDEQTHDPMLEDFRTKFADFCLERLESKEKSVTPRDDDMVEPNPHWRHCYVRAVRELRVNPAKRGHRTLHWSSQHDPAPEVREAAQVAYNEISSHVKLEEGRSPRSAIFAAYWWLRQAHLLALGIEPDADGAQRTRIKELRRTKEAEQVSRSQDKEPSQI